MTQAMIQKLSGSSMNSSAPTPMLQPIYGQRQIPNLDPKVEGQIVQWVDKEYRKAKILRSAIELQWYLNLAFFRGKHYVVAKPGLVTGNAAVGQMLITPVVPSWRVRLVINRVRPIVRTELSKLFSQKPTVTVVPSSSDDKDYFASQAGEQIWDSVYRYKKIKAVLKQAGFWSSITGNGFVKCWWDPDRQDPLNPDIAGDFCFDSITPFHLFVPDLDEEDIENQPFVIHIQTKSEDWIKVNYPELQDVKPDTNEVSDILNDSFSSVTGTPSNQPKRAVLVKEVWVKPSQIPQLPNGGVITVIGKKVCQFTEGWPYSHGMYPFSHIGHIPSGKFYRTSVIEDLIPLNTALNKTRSQVQEHKNYMLKPRILVAQGAMDTSKVTTAPGQYLVYNPGFDRPEPFPVPPIPNYIADEINRTLADINDISGQHEVSRGQTPSGVTAATAISYLQEQDESMLSSTFDSIEDAIEKLAMMVLSYVQQYWVVERIVKIAGSDSTFDVMTFKGADLRNNTDVRVEAGSALPTSKAAKQAFIMDLMKMGFIPPQQGLEVMDIGGLNKITEQIRTDTKQAQRENLKMSAVTQEDFAAYQQMKMQEAQVDPTTGVPTNPEYQAPPDPMTGQPQVLNPPPIIPVNTWDNHAVHVMTHNNFRKSQAFEALSNLNKQLFEAHVQDHIAAMQAEQQMMMPSKDNTQQQQPPPQSSDVSAQALPLGGEQGNATGDVGQPS